MPVRRSPRVRRTGPHWLVIGLWAVPPLAVAPQVARAAHWEWVPTLGVEETYTDNLRLRPGGAKGADWVTTVKPGISVNATGARLKLNAAYSLQFINRAREGSHDQFHQLNARGTLEAVEKLLFVDASAVTTQQNVSILGPQATSNINVTGNRTNVNATSVSPYLRFQQDTQFQGEVRWTGSAVTTSAATNAVANNSTAQRFDAKIASGPAYRLTTWDVAYSREQFDYSNARDVSTDKISAGVKRLITPFIALQVNAGYEDSNQATSGSKPSGLYWSAGPRWTPTPRTNLSATLGRRFFGSNHGLDFSHRTRLTVWSASYSADVTNSHAEALGTSSASTASYLDGLFRTSIPDAALRQVAVQNYITQNNLPATLDVPLNNLSSVSFLSRRWQGGFGINGVRHTVLTNAFTQSREALSTAQPGTGDFAASQRTRQSGANVLWTWRIDPLTSSTVTAGLTLTGVPGLGREDKGRFLRAGLQHQFARNVAGSLNYRWMHNASSTAGADTIENAISAGLQVRF